MKTKQSGGEPNTPKLPEVTITTTNNADYVWVDRSETCEAQIFQALATLKAQIRKEIEEQKVVLHIDEPRTDNIGVEERWGTGYNQALSDCLSIKSLEE